MELKRVSDKKLRNIAGQTVLIHLAVEHASEETPQRIPIAPQRRRRAARNRLTERSNSVAARVMQDLQLARAGREVARAGLARDAMANTQAITMLLQREINNFLGIGSGSRGDLTAAQTEAALHELDKLGDIVRDRIRDAIDGVA